MANKTYPLTKIDSRYPQLAKKYPNKKFIDATGLYFKSINDVIVYYKSRREYTRLKNKPMVKIKLY